MPRRTKETNLTIISCFRRRCTMKIAKRVPHTAQKARSFTSQSPSALVFSVLNFRPQAMQYGASS
jgi:hypothetical protein